MSRKDLVCWLAECQRNHWITVRRDFPLEPELLEDCPTQEIAELWGSTEIPLAYEPRSMVVNPRGGQVAVGTKSGSVVVARWLEGSNSWEHLAASAEEVHGGGHSPPGSIRSLLFLDEQTLVAAWGGSGFSVLSIPTNGNELQVLGSYEGEIFDQPSGWYLGTRRFHRLVPLHDPEQGCPDQGGDLLAGLIYSGNILVLSRSGNGVYGTRQVDPEEVFSGWDPSYGRIVDALWSHGALWLAGGRGALVRYAAGAPGARLQLAEVLRLALPRPEAVIQRIAACEAGLAVLAGEHITFLWHRHGGPAAGVETKDAPWIPIQGAIDCAASLPYPATRDVEELSRLSVLSTNPVWTVVSTAQPGLRWIGWSSKVKNGTRSRDLPRTAAANFAVPGGGSVLYLAFGRAGARALPFLACGTRDHKLLIASVQDLRPCEDTLKVQVALVRQELGAELEKLIEEHPGMAWTTLLRRILSDFGVEPEPPEPDAGLDEGILLAHTGHNQLRVLAKRLVPWCIKGQQDKPAALRDAVLGTWIHALLRRANELGPQIAREIAEVLVEELRSAGHWHAQRENTFTSFANFLRKWVVHGPTYGAKRTQLHGVFEFNDRCGRKLDALVYLTRLMRGRVDPLWETQLPTGSWVPAVWHLATSEKGDLTITSLADGGICATDGDGNLVRWHLGPAVTEEHGLITSDDGLRLERFDSKEFSEIYRHGPYARSLWLQELPGSGHGEHYLLVFCLKGWRSNEIRKRPVWAPTLYALRFSRHKEGRQTTLSIDGIASSQVVNELYAICALEGSSPGGLFTCTLLAGTSGSWRRGQIWEPTPFIEIALTVHGQEIRMSADAPEICRAQRSERRILRQTSDLPEATHNRCWALAATTDASGRSWVWAGFQDGTIRGYLREISAEGGNRWVEGGWGKPAPAGEETDDDAPEPRRCGLKATGPVWRLTSFQGPREMRMLAYGTGDGVVGAVSLDDLETREPDAPIQFLLHFRGDAPICALADFRDEEKHYFLSVDQRGGACLFDLNPVRRPDGTAIDDRKGYRFALPGLRVDRFRTNLDVRALAQRRSPGRPDTGEPPCFFVGTADARIFQLQLRFPSYSRRRKEVPRIFENLMRQDEKGRPVTSILPSVVGSGEVASAHQWLRVLVVGETCLIRFSLWDELRLAGEPILAAGPETEAGVLQQQYERYREVLKRLIEETYRRRPFSEDLAIALWEEGARIAACMARRILRQASDDADAQTAARVEGLLGHYLELNSLFADLCNRWIGVDQSHESTVLNDSFAALFDWHALALIACDPPGGRTAAEVREFLIYRLIESRLNYTDILVPQETLRIINAAISRAVVVAKTGVIPPRAFCIRPRPLPAEDVARPGELQASRGALPHPMPRIGYFDLMTLVGDLWERLSGSLSPSHPVTTEITRFFSLTLLLLPACPLLTANVITESRLSESGTVLGGLILDQARSLQKELLGGETDEPCRHLALFKAYLQETPDLTIFEENPGEIPGEEDKRWGWRYLLDASRTAAESPLDEISDEGLLAEQRHVMHAAAWLSDLDRPGLGEAADGKAEGERIAETARRLLGRADDRPFQHFEQSRTYLRKLDRLRTELRAAAGWTKDISPNAPPRKQAIQSTIRRCGRLIEELHGENLFRPQRDHYEQVILRWRDQLVARAGEAFEVLDIMDSFNRHVYRTSADRLMDNIMNLAMQTAPLSYSDPFLGTTHGAPDTGLRDLILERLHGYPLIHNVFETGEYLVQKTHLAGALLTIARHYAATEPLERWTSTETLGVAEIEEIVGAVSRRTGLSEPGAKERHVAPGGSQARVPGTRAIWDLIVEECAVNIVKHVKPYAPPGTALALHFGLSPTKTAILLAANLPYASCLTDSDEREIFSGKKREDNEKDLQRFFERGMRKDHTRLGAGMGLFMVKRLAELWRPLRVELTLYDMVDETEDLLKLPLCLKISWS